MKFAKPPPHDTVIFTVNFQDMFVGSFVRTFVHLENAPDFRDCLLGCITHESGHQPPHPSCVTTSRVDIKSSSSRLFPSGHTPSITTSHVQVGVTGGTLFFPDRPVAAVVTLVGATVVPAVRGYLPQSVVRVIPPGRTFRRNFGTKSTSVSHTLTKQTEVTTNSNKCIVASSITWKIFRVTRLMHSSSQHKSTA